MNELAGTRRGDGRRPELDGLRAVAILLVLSMHSLAHVPIGWVRQAGSIGWVGVDLFFVLSGFLIGGILMDQRAATNFYQVFYLRRFFRIVPLYAALVLPGLAVLGLGFQRWFPGHTLGSQANYGLWFCPLFLQNFSEVLGWTVPRYMGPAWSLAVEEQFYLLLPLFIRLVTRRHWLPVLTGAIIAAPLLRGGLLLLLGPHAQPACYILLPCRWDALLLGVLGALAVREPRFIHWFAVGRHWFQWLWGVAGVGCAAVSWRGTSAMPSPMAFYGYTLFDLFFAVTLLLAVLPGRGWLPGILRQPGLKPIATVSYGLYLLHGPMLAACESLCRWEHITYSDVSWTATGVVLLSLIATAGVATASWHFYESRFVQWGHRYRFKS